MIDKLSSLNTREVKEIFEKLCKCKVKSVSLSTGEMLYDESKYRMVYLRVEFDEGGEMMFEIYDDSMTIITNMSMLETYTIANELLRLFINELNP